jgi:hypothetical protein
MIIDASDRSSLDLQQIAASAKGLIIIRNISHLSTVDCQMVAASGKERVIFDFTT